jgi:hypothetical protein
MIATKKNAYEFLVRWNKGVITGASVGFEVTTTENGIVLSTTLLPVMAVDIGQGVGFPLADILSKIQIDALSGMAAAQASLTTEQSAHNTTTASLTTAQNELAAALAKLAAAGIP